MPFPTTNRGSISRAAKYLWNYRGQASLPYIFLVIATLSQLAVPRLVRSVIDAVTNGVVAKTILDNLPKIPASFVVSALPKILDFLKLPTNWSLDQLSTHLQAQSNGAPSALIRAGVAIVLFAILRGVFAFLQSYWAERNSQSVAFDLRNDLFAKIQRLSFSYHDRNQSCQ